MMSLSAFSQSVTDTTKIQLTKPVARLVVKDLIQFDSASKEMEVLQKVIVETNNKLVLQTDLVANLQQQNNNLESVIKNLQVKYDTQADLTLQFEKALKKQKRMTTIYKIGTTVGVFATALLLVQ